MKKAVILFVLMASVMFATSICFAQTPFSDIQTHQALSDIEAVYSKGIMIGTAADIFSPDEYVDKAQLAVCLVRVFDLNYDNIAFAKLPVPSDLYDDVGNDLWYSEASLTMAYNGIFDFPDRKFKPHQTVTRSEVAGAIADSFKTKGIQVITTMMWPPYADIAHLPDKQQSDIAFIYNTQIMKYPGSEFKPDEKITRAELATIMNNTLSSLALAGEGS
ncbi:MAG: S-layer homology domain-containing protein [Prolixibacteraceae bacterium]|nr:S-layer homology domain-containing protein [Desulfotomaculaceae bacterium]MDD4756453.1 S-layer homology domain-containing protein [Prolixibacteraceae bacterium]